jgi:hypothetical protein
MSDYTKTTDFTAKDALSTGDPLKLIKGSYFDTEFDAIVTAVASKEDSTNKSSAGGYAGLDGSAKVNDAELATASLTVRGPVELATDAETNTGSDTGRAITPANLAQMTNLLQATLTQRGAVELATNAEANTGTDADRVISPSTLAQMTNLLQATATQRGAVELAIQAEVDAGSDTGRVITCETLAAYGGGFANGSGPGVRGACAYNNSAIAIVTATWTTVLFDSESFDTDTIHDTGSNTGRLTVPAGVTRIRLSAGVQFEVGQEGQRIMKIRKNGGSGGIDTVRDTFLPLINSSASMNSAAAVNCGMIIQSGTITTTATSYFEVQVYQNFGSNLDLLADQAWFEMEILA